MYGVSDDIITAYRTDGIHKEWRVVINGNSYDNSQIVDDSLSLKQSFLESEDFEAIGCNASCFSVDLRTQFNTKVRGGKVQVYVRAGNTQELLIFTGTIDKCTKTANGWNRHIEAYDILYNLSGQSGQADENERKKYDVSDWFNNHSACSISSLLADLCSKFSISLRTGNLPLANGSLTTNCGANHNVTNMSALDLFKFIMQINGCFGYITGDGYFSWKYLVTPAPVNAGWLYPSQFINPTNDIYPGYDDSTDPDPEDATNFIGEYESLEYQDFQMLPINIVKVQNHAKDENAGSAGSGTNTYIIQGNPLTHTSSKADKDSAASNILSRFNGVSYVPFNASLQGLPYLECGDEVNFWDFIGDYGRASVQQFFILSRTLSNGQHMVDNYAADGNEYKHEFVTGSEDNTNVEEAIEEALEDYPNREEVEEMIEQGGGGTTGIANIVSISPTDVPSNPDPLTLYAIQGECRLVEDIDFNDSSDEDEGEGDTP